MRLSVFFDHIRQANEQTGKSCEALLSDIRKAEIEALEINLDDLLSHPELPALFQAADLSVSCIYGFYEMGHHTETERIRRHIDTAAAVGASRILVVPGFLSEPDTAKMQTAMPSHTAIEAFLEKHPEISRMAEGLSQISQLGASHGITVTVEDFDAPASPLSGMHAIHWFLKQIPELQYTFDTGNFLYNGENMLDAFTLLKERIAHVHCKDRSNLDQRSVETGTGYVPFPDILQRLEQMDYNGYLAIEHFDVPDQEHCMINSAAFLKTLMH